MGQQHCDESFRDRTDDASLYHIEGNILAKMHKRDLSDGSIINMTELKYDCLNSGYSLREMSQVVVSLLMRRFLRPCGTFTFCLTNEGCDAVEKASLALQESSGPGSRAV